MSADLEALAGRVDELGIAVGQLQGEPKLTADQVAALVALEKKLDAILGPDADKLIADWLTISDPDLAVLTLGRLHMWVDVVWLQLDRVAPCWPWHPPATAILLACQRAWKAARSPVQSATLMADWLLKTQPEAQRALDKRLCKCDAGHLHDGLHLDVDLGRLEEYAAWWASRNAANVLPGTFLADAPGLIPPPRRAS